MSSSFFDKNFKNDVYVDLQNKRHPAYSLIDSGRLHAQAGMSKGSSRRWTFNHGMDHMTYTS